MMKYSVIFLSFLLISCGEYKGIGAGKDMVGEIKAIQSTELPAQDRQKIAAVCNALAIKSAIISTAQNSEHTFFTSQLDCDGNTVALGDVQVVIQKSGNDYVFKRKADGLDFIFPNVETASSGLFTNICSNISNLTNPIQGTNELTYVTTSGINSNHCASASGEICIQLEKAISNGNTATVHTKEWLRIRTSSPTGEKIGFWTDRKRVSQSYCGNNEVLVFKATLK